jgi:hypothetical protein
MIVLLVMCFGFCFAASPPFGKAFRSEFFINASVTPLNHGAFGSTPRTVMAKQIEYMQAMEEGCDAWFHGNVRSDSFEKDKRRGEKREMIFVFQ